MSAQADALRRRLDAAFARAGTLSGADLEIQSDFARFLCVLVSGYVETVVAQIAVEHCEKRSHPSVSRYAGSQLARLQNVNSSRLLQLVGCFDSAWSKELEVFIEGKRREALDSVAALRNGIAHGRPVNVTYRRISEYYLAIKEIVRFIEQKFT
jgi:hypothetical protein